MIASLNIIDEFLENPHTVRDYALSFDFTQEPEHDGHKYPGFAPIRDERVLRYLEQRLLDSTGHRFTVSRAHFAAGTQDHKTAQWIHADNGVDNFAGVLYLFDQPGYGTAFWRIKHWNSDGLAACVSQDGSGVAEAIQIAGRSGGSSQWTRTDYADSKFNRLIFYPTDRFHSRWPEHGFGDAPENCRLTLAFFFDLAE